jgi:hypothetical protein
MHLVLMYWPEITPNKLSARLFNRWGLAYMCIHIVCTNAVQSMELVSVF